LEASDSGTTRNLEVQVRCDRVAGIAHQLDYLIFRNRLACRDGDWPLSFIDICGALGLNLHAVRSSDQIRPHLEALKSNAEASSLESENTPAITDGFMQTDCASSPGARDPLANF
jgi:hypothetical protein